MRNFRGPLFMTLAMAGYAAEDSLLKLGAHSLALSQVLVIFGLGGMLVFAVMAWAGPPVVIPPRVGRFLIIRSFFELAGRVFYTLAFVLTPLSSASAILQATPLVVALGAALVFREQVGPRRWAAIGIGFLGVLLILRPGLDGFEPASIFAVLGMLGFAGRDLATRAAPGGMSNAALGVAGFAILVLAGLVLIPWYGAWRLPTGNEALTLAAATGFGVFAYNALTIAMRSGEVSLVAPFRYTRLVFAMGIGIVVFAERPDSLTLIGSAVIVGSGVYTLLRERRTG